MFCQELFTWQLIFKKFQLTHFCGRCNMGYLPEINFKLKYTHTHTHTRLHTHTRTHTHTHTPQSRCVYRVTEWWHVYDNMSWGQEAAMPSDVYMRQLIIPSLFQIMVCRMFIDLEEHIYTFQWDLYLKIKNFHRINIFQNAVFKMASICFGLNVIARSHLTGSSIALLVRLLTQWELKPSLWSYSVHCWFDVCCYYKYIYTG